MNRILPTEKRFQVGLCVLAMGWTQFTANAAAQQDVGGQPRALTLSNLVQQVIENSETLHAKLFDFEAKRSLHRAERGIFEPAASVSASREVNNRLNNSEQAAAANGVPVLHENNRLYQAGLEALAPSGAKVQLGYTLDDLWNNVPTVPVFGSAISNHQYQTFAGLTLSQPLLKNFGTVATLASIRVAALSSKIAFQEYRRQLMGLVSTAEATYWGLYLAQEQVRFFEESVATAETILRDNRARLAAGKVSEIEVMEAESGVGLRRAKLNEARQRVVEAVNRVLLLCAETPSGPGLQVRAADVPRLPSDTPALKEVWRGARDLNPDYLAQREKLEQELVRLGYARNQRLPELNLKGAYGLNGLGSTPGDSSAALETRNYDSWSVGLELRVPLGGGVKSRNELRAIQAQVLSAELTLRATENEILNALNTAWHKVQSARGSVDDYQASVNYNRRLLDAALARLEAGKIDSRKVLEIEADLFSARNDVAESLVRYQVAQLELELTQGAILRNRHLEITQAELERAPKNLAKSGKLFNAPFSRILEEPSAANGGASGGSGRRPGVPRETRGKIDGHP